MKALKIIGISILQSSLFVLLSYVIIRTFVVFSDLMPDDSKAAISMTKGANDTTTVFFTSKDFDGDLFFLNFMISLVIAAICNLAALVQSHVISFSILILCNVLLVFYCFLFLNYGMTIMLSMAVISVMILVLGYIILRSVTYL